jgi:putative ABC transport system permease protein
LDVSNDHKGQAHVNSLGNLLSDVRYALRGLRQNPGFAITAILAIAVGIGINSGIFSVLNGFALRDLPVPGGQRLVSIHQTYDSPADRRIQGSRTMFSTAEYVAYRDRAQALSGVLAYARPWNVTLGGESAQEITGTLVSCNYFEVLQRRPALGRDFAPDTCEAQQSGPQVVLAHDLWLTAFGADPAIIGKTIILNRRLFTVAGVAPEGFSGVDFAKVSFFVPLSVQALLRPDDDLFGDPRVSWLTLIGRRADGVAIEQARADLGVIAAQIDAEQPGRRTRLTIARANPFSFPDSRPIVFGIGAVLMIGFGLVLLIACANVANLLLARATARGREIALRLSLGATRGRLVQLLLTESLLIAMAGGVLGSLLAFWSFQVLVAFAVTVLPGPDSAQLRIDPSPDLTVLAYSTALTFVTGIVFGLVPALHASKPALYTALRQDGSTAPGRRAWTRGALVSVQVALCLLLTVCASLLLRGLYTAQTVDPGFDYRNVAVASFDLRGAGYNADEAGVFQRELLDRTAALPGITGAALVVKTPLSQGRRGGVVRIPGEDQFHELSMNNVSPEYFDVLGLPIVRGRTFSAADSSDGSPSIIVTEATARRLWPGQDPLGKLLSMPIGPTEEISLEVVGIAKDASLSSIGAIDDDYAYFPASSRVWTELQMLARTQGDLGATIAGIRAAARAIDPNLVARVGRLEDNLDVWRRLSGLVATLSGSLGFLALVLAAIGVYGLVSFAVTRRLREIGVRIALGARARDVLALVLKQNMRPVLIGAVIGIVACTLVAKLLASMLFGVSTLDPLALGGTTLFVLGAALIASLVPARRALRVDPMTTLRHE